MELVFKEELEELLDTLKELEDYIKSILDEIEYEIEDEESCYGYEYDDEYEEIKNSVFMRFKDEFEFYKLELNNDIDSFIKNVPGVFRDNLFAIGKVRREEILTLLSKVKNLIYDLELDDTISIGKIKNEISDYLSKDIKDLVNERKRQSRRNESGFTKREQEKQDKIEAIYKLKQQGLTQSQVRSKLKFSKGLVSRYWSSVYLNGKWEIYKRSTEDKKKDITLEDEGLIL